MCGIYKITNLINNKKYIGQSIDIEKRWQRHKIEAQKSNPQEILYQAIQKYGIDNFKFEVIEECNSEQLNQREIYWIAYYHTFIKDNKCQGYNMTKGGNNTAGYLKGKPVEQYDLEGNYITFYESAAAASRATGINNSLISACCRGEITHAKMFQWKYLSDNKIIQKLNNPIINNITVYQFDSKGKLIAKYSNLLEASKKTGIQKNSICNVCRLKAKTAGGYIWRYEYNKDLLITNIPHKASKRVGQYSLNGELLNIYNSINEAGEQTGINKANIGQVCSNKRKTAGNFIWKFL